MGMDQILKGLNNVESAAVRKNTAEMDYYRSVKELGQVAVDMIEAAEENNYELSWGDASATEDILGYHHDVTRLYDELQRGFSHGYQFYGALAELDDACAYLYTKLEEAWGQMVIDN